MGSRHFPEIPCIICNKAVDLGVELSADENGKSVHEDCYVKRITGAYRSEPPIPFPVERTQLSVHAYVAL
jgi:hypothetical protein